MVDTPEPDQTNDEPVVDTVSTSSAGRMFGWPKLIVLMLFLAAFAYIFVEHRDKLQISNLAEHEQSLKDFQQDHSVLVYEAAFLLYVTVTGLSLPGASALTLTYGWFFGFSHAIVLVSFASTAGATIAFLLSRYLFRDMVQTKFGDRLAGFNRALEREGAFYLFTLRLIPAVPFFVINIVMGLTPMRVGTYWWISQLGMIPGTCVFVWAGSQFPSLEKLSSEGFKPGWELILAFVLLGVFPIAVKKVMARFRPQTSDEVSGSAC